MTLIHLCGKSIDCRDNSQAFIDDPADPDVAGIGVILAFILIAGTSLLTQIAAYFAYALPLEDYTLLDHTSIKGIQKIWRLLRLPGINETTANRQRRQNPRTAAYQNFLLVLSDQLLVTGFALIVSIYSQLCSASVFSYSMALSMAFFVSSSHISTLTALRTHFQRNGRQWKVRQYFMLAFILLFLAGELLNQLTADAYNNMIWTCALVEESSGRVGDAMYTWIAECLICASVFKMIFVGGLDDDLSLFWRIYIWFHADDCSSTTAYFTWADAQKRERLNRLLERPRKRRTSKIGFFIRLARTLFWNLYDLAIESQLFNIILSSVWFIISIKGVTEAIGDYREKLLKWGFGQVMPVTMWLSLLISAVEAISVGGAHGDSSHHRSEPPKEQSRESRSSGVTERPVRRRTDEPTSGIRRRVTTTMEEGGEPMLPIKEGDGPEGDDILALARQGAKTYINIYLYLITIFPIGIAVLSYFWFEITVYSTTGVILVLDGTRFIRELHDFKRYKLQKDS